MVHVDTLLDVDYDGMYAEAESHNTGGRLAYPFVVAHF